MFYAPICSSHLHISASRTWMTLLFDLFLESLWWELINLSIAPVYKFTAEKLLTVAQPRMKNNGHKKFCSSNLHLHNKRSPPFWWEWSRTRQVGKPQFHVRTLLGNNLFPKHLFLGLGLMDCSPWKIKDMSAEFGSHMEGGRKWDKLAASMQGCWMPLSHFKLRIAHWRWLYNFFFRNTWKHVK